MHCWAILPYTPETRLARERVFAIIDGEESVQEAVND